MQHKAVVPADIEDIRRALEANSGGAESLFAAHSPEELERTRPGGAWNAAQCLSHLAATNLIYVAAMRNAIKPVLHLRNHERSGPLRVGTPTRLFLNYLEPPVRRKFRAPVAILPASSIDARSAIRDFLHAQAAVLDLLQECCHLDLNRIRFPSPFVPALRFTVGSGFLIIAAHNRRHLWQAARGLDAAHG